MGIQKNENKEIEIEKLCLSLYDFAEDYRIDNKETLCSK
jgi:hypothetical protein